MTKKPPILPPGKTTDLTAFAIPTNYAGVSFRSRLEARWAAFFDLLEWPWEYEPIELRGYIPDFILRFKHAPLLVEVKPDLELDSLATHAPKIIRSGWHGEFLIVGSTLHPTRRFEHSPVLGLLAQREHDEAMLGAAETFFCRGCKGASVLHEEQTWNCRACGAYDGDHFVADFSDHVIAKAWADAGNRTQWRPET